MDKNISYYKSIQNAYGTTSKKEYQLSKTKNEVLSHFSDSTDWESDTLIDGINVQLIVIKTNDDKIKSIKSRPNESFSLGQIVDCYDRKYLITSVDANNQIYTTGKMTECNYTIKFQSPDGTILSYPCITSDKSFSQDETKVITIGSNKKSILCAKDTNTLTLKTGRRLYIDTRYETTYTLLDPDTTTYNYGDKGLIYFIAEQDLEQNNTHYPDRPDLGVCNYFEPTITPPTPVGSSYAIISQGGDLVIDNANYIALTPTFYNTDGTLNGSIVSSWMFNYPMTNKDSQFTITYSGNNCLIKVAEDYDLIGEKLTCSVSDGNDGFVGSIDLIINA